MVTSEIKKLQEGMEITLYLSSGTQVKGTLISKPSHHSNKSDKSFKISLGKDGIGIFLFEKIEGYSVPEDEDETSNLEESNESLGDEQGDAEETPEEKEQRIKKEKIRRKKLKARRK